MDDRLNELELLMLAVQQGALNDGQVEELLRELDAVPAPAKSISVLAVERGFISEGRLKELATARRMGESTVTGGDIVMACGTCGKEQKLSLAAAIRRPPCKDCSGTLAYRRPAGAPAVLPSPKPSPLDDAGPVPEEVRKAGQDPRNRFAKYVLVKKLGTGGMGEVWKGWDTVMQRTVALKFPRSVGEDEIRRLFVEAQGAGRLSHPNIAAVYEVAEAQGRHYIAMQFIEGRTAEGEIGASGGRVPATLARWIRDAARAVHYAHENGVIHRDLKPQNFMIDPTGRVFVMDFGLAKLLASPKDATMSGLVLGTPTYMPPEQASGRGGQVDRQSDVYALGATLYVMLSGKRPFDGESATDILIKIITTEPAPLRSVRPDVPPALEAIIEKAMARDKPRRYATAAALADDLDRYLADEPISARRATTVERLARTVRRRRAPIITATAFAALAAAALLAFLTRPPAAARPGPDRLALWSSLEADLQGAIDPDRLDAAKASSLLERAGREFPERSAAIQALLDREHRRVSEALASLPKSQWRERRASIERSHAWLLFAKRPADAARRMLDYRGTARITVFTIPPCEVRGPVAASLEPEDRATPLSRTIEIVDGVLELHHPDFGGRTVELQGLEDGGSYFLEADWKKPETFRFQPRREGS
jgi:serine/threonine protein kinase